MTELDKEKDQEKKYVIDPFYSKGIFYKNSKGNLDAQYKVEQLFRLIEKNKENLKITFNRIADVGCGTGDTTKILQDMIKGLSGKAPLVDGYDIHPYIQNFTETDSVHFIPGNFCDVATDIYDMVVLFDVIEHIPRSTEFLSEILMHAKLVALHIPLDDVCISWIRGIPRSNLLHPGHLLVLNPSSAINLLTISGLRIIDYDYSPAFLAPSSRLTIRQKILKPIRLLLYKISPYLTVKLLAGVSLIVLAWTPLGLKELQK